MASKIIGHVWFSGRTTQGIVLTQDEITGQFKARIGSVSGQDEELDKNYIKDWGSKFDHDIAIILITRYGKYNMPNKDWLDLINKEVKNPRTKDNAGTPPG